MRDTETSVFYVLLASHRAAFTGRYELHLYLMFKACTAVARLQSLSLGPLIQRKHPQVPLTPRCLREPSEGCLREPSKKCLPEPSKGCLPETSKRCFWSLLKGVFWSLLKGVFQSPLRGGFQSVYGLLRLRNPIKPVKTGSKFPEKAL